MRLLALLLATASLASGAFAAERALRSAPEPAAPQLVGDAGAPLFTLEGLRGGDRAERRVVLTNAGPGAALASIAARAETGDLAPLLNVAITRGCDDPTLLWSGRLDALRATGDPEPWPAGEARRYGIAIEVAGSDDTVQGRRAVHEFAFGLARADEGAPPPAAPPAGGSAASAATATTACTTVTLAAPSARRRRRPVLVKYHRIKGRIRAKLIVRIFGAPGQQRLVLMTGLRIGRHEVLMGRRWGRVTYRVGRGAAVTSRTRPFRVRIAPGVLRPGRNVVRVRTIPRRGRAVRARYVLKIVAAPGEGTGCRIG